jgi:hypothetical protein
MISFLRRSAVSFALILLAFASAAGHAESQGVYTHDTLREADEKLIVCYDVGSAMAAAVAI